MKVKTKTSRRVVVYISEEQYRQLKSKLALEGKTISHWLRQAAQAYTSH